MTDQEIETKLTSLEGKIDRLTDKIDKLRDNMDGWVRWILGLQMGTYVLLILAYFTHR